MQKSKAAKLRAALSSPKIVVAAGVYDMISARIADRMDFDSLYMTGYGTVASYLGIADAGLATYTEMVERVTVLAGGTETPMVCDADTGYGGLLNVRRTVQGYEAAGAAGIQIEDQETPKKCGHTLGRRVVPVEDMVLKIKVALEARRNPETVEEIERVGRELKGSAWLLLNAVYDGRTPEVPADELKKMGFSMAIYAGMAHKAAAGALEQAYLHLKTARTQKNMPGPMYPTAKMHDLMGFPDVWAFEKRWDQGGSK